MRECDIIIVGAGSAGCILADQLVRHSDRRIVLVEPPSDAAPGIDLHRPARWLNLLGSSDDWSLQTQPSSQLSGRSPTWPRGRGLGGSSRINAMIWFPPTEQDWTDLSQASGGAWSPAGLRQSFASVQSLVQPEPPRWLSESADRFMAAVSCWPDARPMIYWRMNRRGRRWIPSRLIVDAEGRSRHAQLRIVRATVRRVVVAGDDAVGVEVERRSSAEILRAREGVVLCAGAIGSPQLLLRSGIGPREVLADARIDVRIDSPRVGAGLRDHLLVPVIFSLPPKARFDCRPSVRQLARWQHWGSGPVASNLAECGGLFERGRIQMHLTPTHYLAYPAPTAPAAMTIGVNVTHPKSAGRIVAAGNDERPRWRIEPEYLSDPRDLQGTIEAVRLAREIATTEPLSHWHQGEILPGVKRETDRSIARSVARYAQTLYHPVGTCAMGIRPDAVVDPSLRVRGVNQLWITDASVLPDLPQGNPNAMVMTVAAFGQQGLTAQLDSIAT